MNYKTYLARLKNKGTVMAITGILIGIAVHAGFDIDSSLVEFIVDGICTILVMLGVMNNPTSTGIDLPTKTEVK